MSKRVRKLPHAVIPAGVSIFHMRVYDLDGESPTAKGGATVAYKEDPETKIVTFAVSFSNEADIDCFNPNDGRLRAIGRLETLRRHAYTTELPYDEFKEQLYALSQMRLPHQMFVVHALREYLGCSVPAAFEAESEGIRNIGLEEAVEEFLSIADTRKPITQEVVDAVSDACQSAKDAFLSVKGKVVGLVNKA